MSFGTLIVGGAAARAEPYVLDLATVRIGRAPDNDLQLEDPAVALHHAEILCDPSGCLVLDLGGGVLLDGAPLDGGAQALASGSVLTIGATTLTFQPSPTAPGDDLLVMLLAATPAPIRRDTPAAGIPRADPHATRPVELTRPLPAINGDDLLTELLASVPAAPPAPAAPSLISLTITPREQTAAVDTTVAFTLRVENLASIVDTIDLRVEDSSAGYVPAEWCVLTAQTVVLDVGRHETVELLVTPPRKPTSRAGAYRLRVVARSRERRPDEAVAEAAVEVLPYTEFHAALDPRQLTRWFMATYTLTIVNTSNTARMFTLTGRDEEAQMRFRFTPVPPVLVGPGETRSVRTRVRLSASRIIGKPQTYPFNVTVMPDDPAAQPGRVEGKLVQQPPLPPWALAALLVALVVACLALTITQLIPLLGRWLNPTPSPTAVTATVAPAETAPVVVQTPGGDGPGGDGQDGGPDETPGAQTPTPALGTATAVTTPTAALTSTPTATRTPTATGTPTSVPGAPVVQRFEVSPSSAAPGAPVTITWQITGAERVVISAFGDVPAAGSREHRPEQTTDYLLTATAPGGRETTRIVRVVVQTPTVAVVTQTTAQVITFDFVSGTPVTERTRIQGIEYESRNVRLAFFRVERASLVLTMATSATSYSRVGEVIPYTFSVRNSGDVRLSRVTVNDPSLSQLACAETTLGPGQATMCSGSHIVTQDDLDRGSLTNTATASGSTSEGQIVASLPASTTITRAAAPHLTLSKTAAETGYFSPGDLLHYTLTAVNDGNVALSNVTINDTRISALSCSPAQPAALSPGASLSCVGTYAVPYSYEDEGAPDEVTNSATAAGVAAGGARVSAAASHTIPRSTLSIALSKIADRSSYAEPGETVTYTLVAQNTGTAALSNVVISDPALGALSCAQPATLQPGASLSCTAARAVTQEDLDRGYVDNTAAVSAAGPGGQGVSHSASLRLSAAQRAGLSLGVRASQTGYSYDGGDVITFTLDLVNTGNVTLNTITVDGTLTESYETGSAYTRDHSLPCTPPDPARLEPGRTITCEVRYEVPMDYPYNLTPDSVLYRATASGSDPAGNRVPGNEASAELRRDPAPFSPLLDSPAAPRGLLGGGRPGVSMAAPARPPACMVIATVFDALLAQQAPTAPCLPQAVIDRLLSEDGRVPVSYPPTIYPPGWNLRIADRYVLTADRALGEFVNGAVAAITFPRGVARVSVQIWHPSDIRARYRMYALDEAGTVIGIYDSANLVAAGEFELVGSVPADRPLIRCVLIMGLPLDEAAQPSELRRDITRALAPLFIERIEIPR